MFVEDYALIIHEKGFGNAVNTPLYGGPAIAVISYHVIRISQFSQKTKGVLPPVLVIDANQLDTLILSQLDNLWMFLPTGNTPRGKNIYNRDRDALIIY